MKRYLADIIGISIIILLVAVFFARLFYPTQQLVVTPDYGRSDAWHFSFPTKFALSQSLAVRSLPLWRNDIGNGFPLFAEGQTGALYLPNLILFSLLPPVTAYNAALTLSIMLLGIGMYGFTRILKLSPAAGLFAAVSITFSGLSMAQLPHISLLQGISMLPIVTMISIMLIKNPSRIWWGLLAISVAQQIYAGFPQATFLTLSLSGVIVLWHTIQSKNIRSFGIWVTAVLLGIGGGATQIIPSWEFLRASTDPTGFTPQNATAYSMPIKHLASFIDPFALGSPQWGTYPPFYQFDGSIFWENTPYIGILPIILLTGSVFFIRKNTTLFFWWLILAVAITLAAGKYAPTYIFYSVWPMNLFRVPSRFLWLAIVAAAILAAYTIDKVLVRKKWRYSITILLAFLLAAHTIQLMDTWWSYHLMEPAKNWLTAPESSRFIKDRGSVLTLGEGRVHNEIMVKTGWKNPESFSFLRQGLSPDSNMLWNIRQFDVYAGRFLKRPSITDSLVADSIEMDVTSATISATRLMAIFPVSHIMTYVPLDAPQFTPDETISQNGITLRHYTNPDALPRAYFVHEATVAATLSQAVSLLNDDNFIPGQTVLLEQHAVNTTPAISQFIRRDTTREVSLSDTIVWQEDSHDSFLLNTLTSAPSLLVVTDTFYPGWRAFIDNREVTILAANLSQRAIAVPEGAHTIRFRYEPKSVIRGMLVTGISLFVIMFLTIVPLHLGASDTQRITRANAPRRPGTRRKP